MLKCVSYQLQQRHILAVMLFFALIVAMLERNVLNMAITRMVYLPNSDAKNQSASESVCMAPDWISSVNRTTDEMNDHDQSQNSIKYNWTQEQQGFILSSFYIGYITTHIPGGLLAQNYSAKYVFGLGITISAMLSMLIPWAVQIGGSSALVVIRILMGAAQGPMFPALTQLLSSWIPPAERAFITSFVYSGIAFGIVFVSYFSGIVMYHFGWEPAFYLFGLCEFVWFIVFVILCYDNPASHPFVKTDERNHILRELGQLERHKNQSATPWLEILSSKAVLALFSAMILSDWAYYVTSTTLPKYMNDVLRFSIRDIGVYNSIPWILGNIVSYIFGSVIDAAIANGKISITNARKLAVFLASILPAIFIIAASYAACDHLLVVIFFTLSIGLHGFLSAGVSVNPIDLSPNYAGTIMSIGNGAGALTGILAPYSVGLLTPNAYLSEWRLVFWITFIIHILKTIIFQLWGSGDVQLWNANKNNANESHEMSVNKNKLINVIK